jgi:hypothetical protein
MSQDVASAAGGSPAKEVRLLGIVQHIHCSFFAANAVLRGAETARNHFQSFPNLGYNILDKSDRKR